MGAVIVSLWMACIVGLTAFIISGLDFSVGVIWGGGAWLAILLVAGAAQILARLADNPLDISADINNASYQIRRTFGKAAQAEFLAAIAVDAEPGKNTDARKFAPGQSRETMAAKIKEIGRTHKPLSEYKSAFDPLE